MGVQGGGCRGGELREVLSQRPVKDALQGRHLQVRRRWGRRREIEGVCQEVKGGRGGRRWSRRSRREEERELRGGGGGGCEGYIM